MVILEVGCSRFEVGRRKLRDHGMDCRNRSARLETRDRKAGDPARKRVEWHWRRDGADWNRASNRPALRRTRKPF